MAVLRCMRRTENSERVMLYGSEEDGIDFIIDASHLSIKDAIRMATDNEYFSLVNLGQNNG